MDVKIENKSETKKEIEVVVPVDEMDPYIEKAVKKLSDGMNIKGFRPGKAPRDVVENSVGKEKLYEEAGREAVQETFPKIIEENSLFTLTEPQVDLVKCAPGNDLIYKAVVHILPEIKLPDYKKLSGDIVLKETKKATVGEEEIDQAIDRIRETKAKTQRAERGAEKGDAITLNFKGVFGDDESKKVEEKDFKFVLGKGEMDVLKGFEENILGMKEGETKKFTIPFAGEEKKDINLDVEIISVMERILPEKDDDFAKTFPEIESMEGLREKIKEGLVAEKERKEKEKLKVKVLGKIREKTNFEVPEVLVEKEVDNMLKTIENQLTERGSNLDAYLKEIGKTEEDLRKEWRKKAEENVSYALILHAISKEENIAVTKEEIENEVDRHFSMTGREKEKEKGENLERMRNYVHDVIKNQKVFRVLSISE